MDVIKLMLRFGADVNTQNQDGYRALHYAANGDALVVSKFLLDAGANINAEDQNGKTALHHCIHEGSLLMANLLIPRGADIDWEDETGETPVTLCLRRRNMNMLQIILNHHHMVATAQRRDFAANVLLSAVDYEVGEAVHLIVEGGYSSVTMSDAAGETPLHRAILKCNPQLMELLIDLNPAGESLTATTTMGETPMHYAARHGSVSVVETLLRRLMRVLGDFGELDEATNPLNATNNAGVTCMYVAATTEASTRRGPGEHDAIVESLQRLNARLFPRDCIVLRSLPAEMVLLHEHVRRGMTLWIREAHDQSHEIDDGQEEDDEGRISDVLLTELCFEWVASVAVLPSSSRRANWAGVLLVAISAGYAYELVPLLLELPLVGSAVAGVLDRLERFARVRQEHLVLLQVHAELSAAFGGRGDLFNVE
ncbi:hypothetical protein PF008_g28119 [Phytophthora fragariae]|uniref:Uncharacterized protein n=1 Tax=Phytophthora fragariae TaxID=53985 RepID=A0A6G0QCD1_9STRA|nr:hypothetical protein PF008_g28119 [Phytophthora fragariae]